MKTESEIREYLTDCKKAVKEMEDAENYNDAYIYKGIVEGLEFVLTDNSLVTKEEQSKLNSIGDNINPVPRNLNGRFTIVRAFRIEVVFVEEFNERIEFIIFQVTYGQQDDCDNYRETKEHTIRRNVLNEWDGYGIPQLEED